MPVYHYRARNSSGELVSGELTAESRAEALGQLHEAGLQVVGLDEPAAPAAAAPTRRAGDRLPPPPGAGSLLVRVRRRQRSGWWRAISQGMHAGLGLGQTLEMSSSAAFGALREFSAVAGPRVAGGQPLSEQIAERPDLFSPLEVALCRAGETSGRLDETAKRLADHFDREQEVANSIRPRLVYLGLIWVVMAGAGFVVTVVAPNLARRGTGQSTGLFAGGGTWVIAALILVGLWWAWRVGYASLGQVRYGFDWLRLHLPVVGPQVRKLAAGRYARALADLLDAGLPVGEAAAIAAPVGGNMAFAAGLAGVPAQVRAGTPLSQALLDSGQLPDMARQMVLTGEAAGSTPEMLQRVAEYFEQDATAATQTIVTAAFVIGLLVTAIIVAGFVAMSYMSMLSGAFELLNE